MGAMTTGPTRRSADDSLPATLIPAALIEAWLSSHRSPNTRAAYGADLKTFRTWCAHQGAIPLRADAVMLLAFQAAREAAGDSPSTVRRRWASLSSFFTFALVHEATASNPALGISRPTVASGNPSPTTQLSPHAVAGYRAIAADLDPRLDALVGLLVADGLKLGEALALDVDDVIGRPPRVALAIRRRGAPQRIQLDVASGRAVRRCIGQRRTGPLFISRGSKESEPRRLTRFGADHLIRQLSTGEVDRVTANQLRRFHITSGHRDDHVDLDNVRERAGLADVRSVRRYLPPELT